MHVLHNISLMDSDVKVPALYEILCIIPILGVSWSVPFTVMEITLAKAFVSPDPDIIDRVIVQQEEAHRDLLYVQQQIISLSDEKKMLAHLKKATRENHLMRTPQDLQNFLARLHINVAKHRLGRMMHLLDADSDGSVSIRDFFTYAGFENINIGTAISDEQFDDFRQEAIRTSMRSSTVLAGKVDKFKTVAGGSKKLAPLGVIQETGEAGLIPADAFATGSNAV